MPRQVTPPSSLPINVGSMLGYASPLAMRHGGGDQPSSGRSRSTGTTPVSSGRGGSQGQAGGCSIDMSYNTDLPSPTLSALLRNPRPQRVSRVIERSFETGITPFDSDAPAALEDCKYKDESLMTLANQMSTKNRELAAMEARLGAMQAKDAANALELMEARKKEAIEITRLQRLIKEAAEELSERNQAIGDLEMTVLGMGGGVAPQASASEGFEEEGAPRELALQGLAARRHRAELAARHDRLSNLNAECEQRTSEIADLDAQLSEQNREMLMIETQIAQVGADCTQLWYKWDRVRRDDAAEQYLQDQIGWLRKELQEKDSKIADLSQELEQERARNQQARSAIEKTAENGGAEAGKLDVALLRSSRPELQESLAALLDLDLGLLHVEEDLQHRHKVVKDLSRFVEEERAAGGAVSSEMAELPGADAGVQDNEAVQRLACDEAKDLTLSSAELANLKAELAGKRMEVERLTGAESSRGLLLLQKKEEVKYLASELEAKRSLAGSLDQRAGLDPRSLAESKQEGEAQVKLELDRQYLGPISVLKQEVAEKQAALEDKIRAIADGGRGSEMEDMRLKLSMKTEENAQLQRQVELLHRRVAEKDAVLEEQRRNRADRKKSILGGQAPVSTRASVTVLSRQSAADLATPVLSSRSGISQAAPGHERDLVPQFRSMVQPLSNAPEPASFTWDWSTGSSLPRSRAAGGTGMGTGPPSSGSTPRGVSFAPSANQPEEDMPDGQNAARKRLQTRGATLFHESHHAKTQPFNDDDQEDATPQVDTIVGPEDVALAPEAQASRNPRASISSLLFEAIDRNNDGFIDRNELRNALRSGVIEGGTNSPLASPPLGLRNYVSSEGEGA